MTKKDFIVKLTGKIGHTKGECEFYLDCFTGIIEKELKNGGEVSLQGIGKLKVKSTKARTARNPRTGETIQIPAGKKVIFVASKELKENL